MRIAAHSTLCWYDDDDDMLNVWYNVCYGMAVGTDGGGGGG